MKILVTAPYNEEGRKELSEFAEVVYHSWKEQGRAYNEEELMNLLRESGADALITEHDEVSSNVISAFPDLKFIGVCRGTPSNVSLDTAKQYDIPVLHTPARNAQATAVAPRCSPGSASSRMRSRRWPTSRASGASGSSILQLIAGRFSPIKLQ